MVCSHIGVANETRLAEISPREPRIHETALGWYMRNRDQPRFGPDYRVERSDIDLACAVGGNVVDVKVAASSLLQESHVV